MASKQETLIYLHIDTDDRLLKVVIADGIHRRFITFAYNIPPMRTSDELVNDALHILMGTLRGFARIALPVKIYTNIEPPKKLNELVQQEIDDYMADNIDQFSIRKIPSIYALNKKLRKMKKLARKAEDLKIVGY